MFVRRTLAALAIGAVLAGETATAASAGVPEGMTKGAYRALHIRSEALSNRYGNAVRRLSPDVLNALAVPILSRLDVSRRVPQALVLVEWPERAGDRLPREHVPISLQHLPEQPHRRLLYAGGHVG